MFKASSVVVSFILLVSTDSYKSIAQESKVDQSSSKLRVTLKNVLSDVETAAVAGAIKLTQNPGNIFATSCLRIADDCTRLTKKAWLLDLVPEFDIEAAENGGFQKITAKVSGNYIIADTSPASDIFGAEANDPDRLILRSDKLFHVFPISAVIETTRFFDSTAAIGEIGYVPFYPNLGKKWLGTNVQLGLNPYFGVFLQGGYKFDTSSKTLTGGSVDQSSETEDDYVARVKGVFEMTLGLPKLPLINENSNAKLITWARGWYDIAHNDFYHSAGGILRFEVPSQKNATFDLKFENGSGAPNFNTGSQFTAGLSWTF